VSPPDRLRSALLAAAWLAAAAACAPSAHAQANLKTRLDAVERDIDRARSERESLSKTADEIEKELRDIKLRGVALARELHRRDEEVSRLEDQITALESDERAKTEELSRRRSQLAATLGALQRIARLPATTLLAMPRPPDETIRSAILLRSAVPELQREAAALGRDISALADLRERIGEDRRSLDGALAGLEEERKKLASATAQKMALLQSTHSAAQTAEKDAARLSARAANMRDLLDRLDRERKTAALRGGDFEPKPDAPASAAAPAPPPADPRPEPRKDARPETRPDTRPDTRTAAVAPQDRTAAPARPAFPKGTVLPVPAGALPAPGRIVMGYGETMPNGITSKGVSIATRPSAPVVAPQPGRVVFAGHFRGYGNLVIIELRDHIHILISGMEKIHASVGDEVLAGEPVGEMTPSTKEAPRLYFEVRRRGQPVNPMPPGAAHRNKVSG
jgi:septal ring factor EnvC (AmiA/AmiB activator)